MKPPGYRVFCEIRILSTESEVFISSRKVPVSKLSLALSLLDSEIYRCTILAPSEAADCLETF